jgi:hypothetical protein
MVQANRKVKNLPVEEPLTNEESWIWNGSFPSMLATGTTADISQQMESAKKQQEAEEVDCTPALSADDFQTNRDGFTVVVNTFRRDSTLRIALERYLACLNEVSSTLKEVRVSWNDPSRELPDFLLALSRDNQGKLAVDRNLNSNLTNRFLPRDFQTDSIFSVDDDMVYECKALYMGYDLWRLHPSRLLTYPPFMIFPRLTESDRGNCHTKEVQNKIDAGLTRPLNEEVNLGLVTKGGFLHRRWYDLFFANCLERERQLVNEYVTGEDLMMAMLHAKVSHMPFVPLTGDSNLRLDLPTDPTRKLTRKDTLSGRMFVSCELSKTFGNPLLRTNVPRR